MDDYLEILIISRVNVCIIHGDQDLDVPLECSNNIKMKFPEVELNIIQNADHGTVILGRENDFAKSLEHVDILPDATRTKQYHLEADRTGNPCPSCVIIVCQSLYHKENLGTGKLVYLFFLFFK